MMRGGVGGRLSRPRTPRCLSSMALGRCVREMSVLGDQFTACPQPCPSTSFLGEVARASHARTIGRRSAAHAAQREFAPGVRKLFPSLPYSTAKWSVRQFSRAEKTANRRARTVVDALRFVLGRQAADLTIRCG